MNLYHFSLKPIQFDYTKEYGRDFNYYAKPGGFWVSVGNEWKNWCERTEFSLYALRYRTSILINDWSLVLLIDRRSKLNRFNNRYGYDIGYLRAINWNAVKCDYSGIIIAPYFGRCFDWYNSWDVASGCFWDLSCLQLEKSIENGLK